MSEVDILWFERDERRGKLLKQALKREGFSPGDSIPSFNREKVVGVMLWSKHVVERNFPYLASFLEERFLKKKQLVHVLIDDVSIPSPIRQGPRLRLVDWYKESELPSWRRSTHPEFRDLVELLRVLTQSPIRKTPAAPRRPVKKLPKSTAKARSSKPMTTPTRRTQEKTRPPSRKQSVNRIFVSYRRGDSADVTGRIYDRLTQHFGNDAVFKDVDSIPLGKNFKQVLDAEVGKCKVLLAVVGDQWLKMTKSRIDDPKDFARLEIESALNRKIPVIPVLVRRASMPPEERLPTGIKDLADQQGISIRHDPDFHRDIDRLITGLEKLGLKAKRK